VRIEPDTLGEVAIPDDAMWGPQTQRAIENFPISKLRFGRRFIEALARVKRACARANIELGALPREIGEAVVEAATEVVDGRWDDQFPVDVFQTGSGTSTNMNANEVIAHRASQILGGRPVHPNDHVNRGQSSNDVIPTVIHVAVTLAVRDDLIPALDALRTALAEKARAFDHIVKSGRTHLQEATPIRLGQEFGGYERQCSKAIGRAETTIAALREVPLGGTAVGTGLNRPPGLPERAIAILNAELGTDFVEAANHVEANAARDAIVEASGEIRTIAVSLSKIANDIRWLGSGLPVGLGEIRLPVVQPGSSMMPGKVNPVLAEALLMVAAQVIANDLGVVLAGEGGNFELNTMMPLMAHNTLSSIEWMTNAVRAFTDRCVAGIEADEQCCARTIERSTALATALAPAIGYERAAEIAREAHRSGRTVREVAAEANVLPPGELDALLDPRRMTEPDS
jgi:fumarate hydratase class II